jgi:hypothetical protein
MTDTGDCTWRIIEHPVLGPNTVEYTVHHYRKYPNNFRAYPIKEGVPPGDDSHLDWEIEVDLLMGEGYIPTEDGDAVSLSSAFNKIARVDGDSNCMIGFDVTSYRKGKLTTRYLDRNEASDHLKSPAIFEENVPYNVILGKNGNTAYVLLNGEKLLEGPFEAGPLHAVHAGAYGVGVPPGAKLYQGPYMKVRMWKRNA